MSVTYYLLRQLTITEDLIDLISEIDSQPESGKNRKIATKPHTINSIVLPFLKVDVKECWHIVVMYSVV